MVFIVFFFLLFMFSDPACQNINVHDHCYVQHPLCPSNVDVSNDAVGTTNQTITDGDSRHYMFVIIPIIVISLLVLWVVWKKNNWKLVCKTCGKNEIFFTYVYVRNYRHFLMIGFYIEIKYRSMSLDENYVFSLAETSLKLC